MANFQTYGFYMSGMTSRPRSTIVERDASCIEPSDKLLRLGYAKTIETVRDWP